MDLGDEGNLNDSSKSIDILDEKLNQPKTDRIAGDDEDKSNFKQTILEENKERNGEAKDQVLLKRSFEKENLNGSSFDEEDHENGNVCPHSVNTNKDPMVTNDLAVNDSEPNDNFLVCGDMAALNKSFKNLAQRKLGVEMNSTLQRRRSSQVFRIQ